MNWEQLLELAEMLAGAPAPGETRGRPQQTHLRKANSATYYAMLHALANSNADTLIRSAASIRDRSAFRRSEEWTATRRALNHGTAKSQMLNASRMATFDADIPDFAETFIALQVQRHEADYNPNPATPLTRTPLTSTQAMRNIQRARDATQAYLAALTQERRRFATHLLFARRS